MRSKRVALIAAAALALQSMPVFAADADDKSRVRALAAQGQREFNLGHYEQALRALEEAYRIKPVPGLLYNVAQCHRLLGHLEDARKVYRAFIDADPGNSMRPTAEEKLAEVEKAIAANAAAAKSPPQSLAPTPPAPVPPAALPTQVVTQENESPTRWPYWVGGAAVVAGGVVAVLLLTRSKSTSEPAGVYNGR